MCISRVGGIPHLSFIERKPEPLGLELRLCAMVKAGGGSEDVTLGDAGGGSEDGEKEKATCEGAPSNDRNNIAIAERLWNELTTG